MPDEAGDTGLLHVGGGQRQTDAGAHCQCDAVDHDRGGERLEDPIRDHDGVVYRPLDQQRKLVAAESGDGVSAAHIRRQAVGDSDQQLVACGIAEFVVDGLEAIEV